MTVGLEGPLCMDTFSSPQMLAGAIQLQQGNCHTNIYVNIPLNFNCYPHVTMEPSKNVFLST